MIKSAGGRAASTPSATPWFGAVGDPAQQPEGTPILLGVLHFAQGVSLGGQWAGAVLMLTAAVTPPSGHATE